MRHYSKLQTKGWTPERRTLQAIRVRQYKPWLRSTGPKTVEGKRKVSMNALKHGCYGPQMRAIKSYFAASWLLLKTLDRKLKEREEMRKVAQRAAKQTVLHITADAPLPGVRAEWQGISGPKPAMIPRDNPAGLAYSAYG